jgi:hypothetical protein
MEGVLMLARSPAGDTQFTPALTEPRCTDRFWGREEPLRAASSMCLEPERVAMRLGAPVAMLPTICCRAVSAGAHCGTAALLQTEKLDCMREARSREQPGDTKEPVVEGTTLEAESCQD